MEAAYQLKPLPDLQYNLAQCYERLGRYNDAATAYETYLKAQPGGGRSQARRDAHRQPARARGGDGGRIASRRRCHATEKVVFKTIVVYKTAPPPPGRGVRIAAYGLGVLALGAAASGIAFAVLAKQDADAVTHGRLDDEPAAVRRAERDAEGGAERT